jgi:hypothetical protein
MGKYRSRREGIILHLDRDETMLGFHIHKPGETRLDSQNIIENYTKYILNKRAENGLAAGECSKSEHVKVCRFINL